VTAQLLAALQGAEETAASDGGGIALVGMATVFIGLLVLSLSLPLLRQTTGKRPKGGKGEGEAGKKEREPAPRLSEQEKAAIAAAIHVHLNSLDQLERMKLTWEMYERPYSPWRLAGRAEALEARGALTFRLRSR